MRTFFQALRSIDMHQGLQSATSSTRISVANIDQPHRQSRYCTPSLGAKWRSSCRRPCHRIRGGFPPNSSVVPVPSRSTYIANSTNSSRSGSSPSLVLFGISHRETSRDFISTFRNFVGTKRVLVATAADSESIFQLIDITGIDAMVLLPGTPSKKSPPNCSAYLTTLIVKHCDLFLHSRRLGSTQIA